MFTRPAHEVTEPPRAGLARGQWQVFGLAGDRAGTPLAVRARLARTY